MAITVGELREFMDSLDDDAVVAIDEGGLCLVIVKGEPSDAYEYIEIGGIPDEEI